MRSAWEDPTSQRCFLIIPTLKKSKTTKIMQTRHNQMNVITDKVRVPQGFLTMIFSNGHTKFVK